LRVEAVQADEALDEVAEDQRALAGFGMHVHQRVLGLVNRGREHLAMASVVGIAGLGLARGVVVVARPRPSPGSPWAMPASTRISIDLSKRSARDAADGSAR
jgi:hypothetical protein